MNAVALLSLREPGVALSDALLASLDADESTAVFAHEVAHLEHYTVARLRAAERFALRVGLAVAVLPVAMLHYPQYAVVLGLTPIALAFYGMGKSRSRRQETSADLRAVELTNDPDALIRGLTKIHQLAYIPRRWGHDTERRATHPSLARRIQAIRASAVQQPAAAFAEPSVFRSASEDGACVVLGEDRAYWFEGVPSDAPLDLATLRERAGRYRVLAYDELTELHVSTSATPRVLHAADRYGQAWETAIRDEDVARLQAALDLVDGRLAEATASAVAPSGRAPRVLAAVTGIAALLAGLSPVIALVALVAVFEPTIMSVVAVATMTLLWCVAIVASAATYVLPSASFCSQVAGIAALGLAWMGSAWMRSRSKASTRSMGLGDRLTIGALVGSIAVLAYLAMNVERGSARSAPMMVSLAIAIAGLGASLVTTSRRIPRLAGSALALGAVAALALVIETDVLHPPSPDVAWSRGRLAEVAAVPVDRDVNDVNISPRATRYLTSRRRRAFMLQEQSTRPAELSPFVTGSFAAGSAVRTVNALDAALVGESRMLVLSPSGSDSVELRMESLTADTAQAVLWRETLPRVAGGRLLVVDSAARWRLSGRTDAPGTGARFVTLSGAMAGGEVRRAEVPADTTRGDNVFAFEDGSTLRRRLMMPSRRSRAPSTLDALSGLVDIVVLGRSPVTWSLWRYDSRGQRLLTNVQGIVECGPGRSGEAMCIETSLEGTRVLRMVEGGGAPRVSLISRKYEGGGLGSDGLVVTMDAQRDSLGVMNPETRSGVRAGLPPHGQSFPLRVQATPGNVVALLRSLEGTRLVLYRLDSEPPTASRVSVLPPSRRNVPGGRMPQ